MHPTITPLDATLGATVTDIDLANLGETTLSIVKDAFHEYAARVFPNQHLTEEAQIAFANRFGEIEISRGITEFTAVNISNQKPDALILRPNEHRHKTLRDNEDWHSDWSYMPLAAET